MEKTLQQIENEINAIKLNMQTFKGNQGIQTSIDYYRGDHTKINSRKMEYVHDGKLVEDMFKANAKCKMNDYRTIVDQLQSYLLGKEPSLSDVDEDILEELPSKKAWAVAKKALKRCQIQRIAWVQPYIDSDTQNVTFMLNERSDSIIPIYSDDISKKLAAVIKFYDIDVLVNEKVETVTKIEYWDTETVTYYKSDKDKISFWEPDVIVRMNPEPHIYSELNYTNGTVKTVSENKWGRVPFIPVQFNDEYQTALEMVGKDKIDALDFMLSDGVNNFLDMADVIYILKDYIGKPEEALFNLKTKRAAVVGGDGNVDSLTSEIPMDQREKIIKLLKQAIYQDGMAVDLSNLTGGSITNVLIQAYFELLDMKANNVSDQIEYLYHQMLMYVDIKQQDFSESYNMLPEPTVKFDKTIIVNEIEYINAANTSSGFISDKTRWEYDPRVSDPAKEAEQVELESGGIDEE